MKKIKGVQVVRLIVQLFFLVVVSYVAFMHQVKGGGPGGAPNIHSICPFGGIETIFKFFAGGEFIKKINMSNIVLLVGIIVLTITAARYFCGWICALGTMQELMGKLGKKLFKKRFIMPAVIDKPLRYLKYVLLVLILALTWKTGTLVINAYDPFAAYAHIPAGLSEVFTEYLIGMIILIGSLVLSMFYDRFFCKYMCPLGGFLGILSKISIFKIKRNADTCTSCTLCNKKCPVNIPVSGVDTVKSAECISCYECVTSCPTKKPSLTTTIFKKALKPVVFAITGLVIYMGIIGIANITGHWRQLPTSINEAISGDPENIRGWMTLEDVSKEFNIELKKLYKKLDLDKETLPPDIKIKEMDEYLEAKGIEFDHDEVKEVVKEILGKHNGDGH